MSQHRRGFVRRAAPRYQWCGHQSVQTLETSVATAASEIILLCAFLGDTNQQSTVTVERIIMSFLIHRILATEFDACAFVVAIQETVPATGAPVTVINPLDTAADNFTLGLKQILMTGLLGWPPVILRADDTSKENSAGMYQSFEFNGRRKLNRMNHAVTLTVNTDVTAVLRMFVQTRVLLRFS